MKTLDDTLAEMGEENEAAAKLQEALSNAGQRRESLFWQMEKQRKDYGRKLRTFVKRRAARIVQKHSRAWCVDVRLFPLHDHVAHVSRPMLEIKWADRGTELKMTCLASTSLKVVEFLERFESVIKATQLYRT